MTVRTALIKVLFKNWHVIKPMLKLVPNEYRKKILKITIDIIFKNKLPFTLENIKKVLQVVIKNNDNPETYLENFDSSNIVNDIKEIEVNPLLEVEEEESELVVIGSPDDVLDFEEFFAKVNNESLKFKIIFLSGEGVIFNSKRGNIDGLSFLEPSFVALKKIIEETGASIIITTSLRKKKGGKMLLEMKFKEYGIDKYLIGYTVETLGKRRKDKIKEKIKDLDEMMDNYVIFDRRTDLGKTLSKALISCSNGIDKDKVEKSIEILNK